MNHSLPTLIVGQGLAGSILALTFFEAGIDFIITDIGHEQGSSWVAAGIASPVTGRKPSLTWMAKDLFPFFYKSYRRWEILLDEKFFFPIQVFRPAMNVEEMNDFEGLCALPDHSRFLKTGKIVGDFEHLTTKEGVFTTQSAWLDVPVFLRAVREFFKKRDLYRTQLVEYGQLNVTESEVLVHQNKYQRIVFAEGYMVSQNPWFNYLPLSPAKGEIIEVSTTQDFPDLILNKGCFVLPLKKGRLKIGATYSWKELNNKPSEAARIELLEKAKALVTAQLNLLSHKAGVRPATRDRRPFIGQHAKFKPIYIFNGFGSKGVSLIPYFANEFLQHLQYGKELAAEVNILRYHSFYQGQ